MYTKLFIFLFFIQIHVLAQVTQEWVQRYNGSANNNDIPYSMFVDIFGNVYVTGSSYGNGTYDDFATVKYNSSGVQQWVQRYNGSINYQDRATSIIVDTSGNVYVTGGAYQIGTNQDYTTIKYNSSGVQQWVQIYNGTASDNDNAHGIAVDNYGNVYVTGISFGSGSYQDYVTIKYNSLGIQQWVQRYNGTADSIDDAKSIVVDASGNIYVTGTSMGNGTNADFVTIKYNSSGVQLWIQRYSGPGSSADGAFPIRVDASGNIYVTGESFQTSTSSFDCTTIKYNSGGKQQWVQSYNGPGNGNDLGRSLVIDGSGNVYVTGYSQGNGTLHDYATIKYNSAGVQQWVQRYNGPGNRDDESYSIAVDASGNVYVTGGSYLNLASHFDYTTIKYNTSGIQQWVQIYSESGNSSEIARSIALDYSGNVYVTGSSYISGTADDYTTIKYSQLVGIKQITGNIPDKFLLYQNYPNPFNPTTKIHFDIPKSNIVKLAIFDVLGRETATLINELLKSGSYDVGWNGSDYPSGIYFYKLTSGDYSETMKMVLIK